MSQTVTPYPIDCFLNIVGLSEIDCECLEANTFSDSLSGLWIDKAEGLSLRMIDAVKDCENENNLWLIMEKAKENAIRQLISDTNNRLLQKYRLARSNYYGVVGRQDFKNNRNINKTYAGIRMATANIAGGYARIKAITTMFSATEVKELIIYNNLNEVIETVDLQCKNGRERNVTDILLPLWDKRIDNLEYFFLYEVTSNACKDNVLHCNCGGVHYDFNMNKPYYKSVNNKLEGWAKWLMVGNYETNVLEFQDLCITTDNYMNGLSLETDLYCDLGMQFCFDQPDKYDPTFLTVAFAIQHLAAYKLIIELLASPNVNRYTMMGGETLKALMDLHLKKYEEDLQWLIDNANTENTNCLACKDKIKIGVGSL